MTPPGTPIRVLVVDDNQSVRGMLVQVLTSEGFDVVGEGEDGDEGVLLAGLHRPDAILMDIRMPKLDGLEAGRRIHYADPDVKLVFLSAFDDATLRNEASAISRSGFLVKGCPLANILSALRDPSQQRTTA